MTSRLPLSLAAIALAAVVAGYGLTSGPARGRGEVVSAGGTNGRPQAARAAQAVAPDPGPGSTMPPRAAVQLGVGASLGGRRLFPDDNAWNTEVYHLPVDPNSQRYVQSIGANAPLHPDFGTRYGIPYLVVSGDTPRLPVEFQYPDESDPALYPVPLDAPIEGGGKDPQGDRHVLVLDRDNWKLFELFAAAPDQGFWRAGSGAIYDLRSDALRPAGWTSADAAGLPVLPGLVRYDEVGEQKEIRHALRFTVRRTRRAYTFPARHYASRNADPNLPPMGMRVRLKAAFDVSGFPPSAQVILAALKRYGMILADNGSDWFISGAPDRRWDDAEISALKRVKGSDLEVVRMGNVISG